MKMICNKAGTCKHYGLISHCREHERNAVCSSVCAIGSRCVPVRQKRKVAKRKADDVGDFRDQAKQSIHDVMADPQRCTARRP